jgi:phosphoribosylanthranilate isomerase
VKIKLCGLANEHALQCAGAARPDAIGLVFAASPRQVRPEDAERLLSYVPAHVQRWAVFRTPDADILAQIAHLPLTGVQGDASWDGAGLPAGWAFLPVFNDGPDLVDRVRAAGHHGRPHEVDGLIGALLLDGAKGGGQGVVADWARCAEVARLGPVVLAGGLTPENVAAAIAAVRPYAVDVSSGTESSPGHKDPARVTGFVEAARAAAAGAG